MPTEGFPLSLCLSGSPGIWSGYAGILPQQILSLYQFCLFSHSTMLKFYPPYQLFHPKLCQCLVRPFVTTLNKRQRPWLLHAQHMTVHSPLPSPSLLSTWLWLLKPADSVPSWLSLDLWCTTDPLCCLGHHLKFCNPFLFLLRNLVYVCVYG